MEQWLQRQWYQRTAPPLWGLPFSALFWLLSALHRRLYRWRLLARTRLPVPVIVVGNITVGGTGKTPLTLALARALRRTGWHPGIVSRGYGAAGTMEHAVSPQADPGLWGDEPVLLAQQAGVPVWVGRRRVRAAQALLSTHPEVDVVLCDDGLQHLALERDLEVVVVDGQRRFGNGALLPAGPLRELPRRLNSVDAVVITSAEGQGESSELAVVSTQTPCFELRLRPVGWRNLADPGQFLEPTAFRGLKAHAVAGIGNPARFFASLNALGVEVIPHPFPDHHRYEPEDLAFGSALPLLMTEKDGVKCRRFAAPNQWVLEIEGHIDSNLLGLLTRGLRLEGRDG